MAKKQYFGTDGIRGRVGEGSITPEFMLRLGYAVGRVFAQQAVEKEKKPLFLIGKDTRISGYMFESALEAGLVAAGADVLLIGPMPTPAIAYLTRTFQCDAGIVISASHNPFYDNGIKFFCAQGKKLSDEIELAIEAAIGQSMTVVDSADLGRVRRVEDAAGRYIEFCKSTVPMGFNLRGLRVVVDCANGATYQVAPAVLRELGAEVITVGAEPDGININDDVGSTQPAMLCRAVVDHCADVGVAFDGDGDRVLFVDNKGEVLDGDSILYVIAKDRIRTKGDCNGVVGTLMSNLGFELALRDLGVPFARAKVGDRYVKQLMIERGWLLGGETSGHIICADATSTGDGMVAALKIFFAIIDSGESLSTLVSDLKKFPQVMINVARGREVNLDADPSIASAVERAEQELGETGRVLLRPSGTEPLVRVMVEGQHPQKVSALAEQLADEVRRLIA